MQEHRGDLFSQIGIANAILITTNGFVRRDGAAVMGRGCAEQAAQRWPELPFILGKILQSNGNIPHFLTRVQHTQIWSFPVKAEIGICADDRSNIVKHMRYQFEPGEIVPGWALKADLSIILDSAEYIAKTADDNMWSHIVLPRPGCGAGELSWSQVEPVLQDYLDDRFVSYTFGEHLTVLGT